MPYAELHCKTNFSFLEGASHPEELAERAAELGYAALAVTDRDSLAGVVRAHSAAKKIGLKILIGAEITLADAPPVVLWATDRAAYGRLSRLITLGRRRAPKGECRLTLDDVAGHAEGLVAGIADCGLQIADWKDGGLDSSFNRDPKGSALSRGATRSPNGSRLNDLLIRNPQSAIRNYLEIFADRCYLLAELHRGADDERRLGDLLRLSKETRIPLVAAGGVLYHTPARQPLHDVLTATRHHTTVAEAGELLLPNAQRHLKALDEIQRTFAAAPEAIEGTLEIADRCTFSLDELRYEYPKELAPPGCTPMEYLVQLTWSGAAERYPSGTSEKVRQLLEHELRLIEELRYEAFFLTVDDLVRFARGRGILCQGRGSAANSAVCFCLGVTAVDPAEMDVLFERFVSREREEAPDIDVDFEHERREEVLQYLYEKYGRERAGIAAEVITYRSRSAIRDVGKALGLSLDRVDALAKQVEGYEYEPRLAERCRQVGIDAESDLGQRLVYLVNELIGFPRHLSQHVGGMVMTQGPLCELVPIENAAMPDRTVVQWDKDDLDSLGILKVDCLALGMLTAIRKCFDFVSGQWSVVSGQPTAKATDNGLLTTDNSLNPEPRTLNPPLSLATIPPNDQAVYDMICRADTMGVFQIESRAQMSMLPRLRPRCYYDLVIEVAIVRPGPIQGQMVHPYLRRRAGDEKETYPNEEIRQVLHKTLGVPIFQEQAMRLAVAAAGFTPGEADQLRRAMGAWRRVGEMDRFRQKLIDGMLARGLSLEFAERVFQQIRGFGEYGFPESHAASFAKLVYVSAWLKHHYPAAFAAALLNSQPMGFYAPPQLVRDARSHGVEVRPVDVVHSCWDCTLEGTHTSFNRDPQGSALSALPCGSRLNERALRLGLRLISGLPQVAAATIESARASRPFQSMQDFIRRTGFSRAVVLRLARADAFRSLGHDRRSAVWKALATEKKPKVLPLFDQCHRENDSAIELPPMTLQEEVFHDYQTAGLSLKAHPISFHRAALDSLGVVSAAALAALPDKAPVRVAGLVLLRQRPSTAKGITFVTLEDETGTINLVVHQQTWDRFYPIARRSPAWLAQGNLQCKDSVIHVVVQSLEDLSRRLGQLRTTSRDFR